MRFLSMSQHQKSILTEFLEINLEGIQEYGIDGQLLLAIKSFNRNRKSVGNGNQCHSM